MLSTISGGGDVEFTKKFPLVRPTIKSAMVVDYNKYKGGVDKFDQFRNYYSSGHHAKKWWKVLFFNFLDMAITNSHICHKLKYNNSINSYSISVNYLSENFSAILLYGKIERHLMYHILVDNGNLIVCLYCAQKRRRAPKSAIRTTIRCLKCNKGFCRYSKRDCFYKYHNFL